MKRTMVKSETGPHAIGPYSPAIRANGMLFISGQLGIDPITGELERGIRAQTERALKNLEALLSASNLGFADIAKTTVFLADLADFAAFNEIYAAHAVEPYPARSTVQVAGLPRGALVEIEAIALY